MKRGGKASTNFSPSNACSKTEVTYYRDQVNGSHPTCTFLSSILTIGKLEVESDRESDLVSCASAFSTRTPARKCSESGLIDVCVDAYRTFDLSHNPEYDALASTDNCVKHGEKVYGDEFVCQPKPWTEVPGTPLPSNSCTQNVFGGHF